MSRGLGHTQREILEWLKMGPDKPRAIAYAIVEDDEEPSRAVEVSVRRALGRLRAMGLVERLTDGRWTLAGEAARQAEHEREQQERDDEQRQGERHKRKDRKRRKERERYEELKFQAKRTDERNPTSTRRLILFLGMLGSAHEGERANAAKMIEAERQRLGKTWPELIVRSP